MARDAPRIGIFGGTFDPIHNGHLQVAEEVRRALQLDRLLMVVANEPWQKQDRPVTPAEDRYAMVVAALVDHPGLEPSRMELDRGGPSYTVETVRELLAEQPDAEHFVVVGADVVGGLSSWHEESALRKLVILAVVDRPGAPAVVTPPGWRTVLVPVESLDVSSTGLRTRLEQGRSVSGTVPESVIRCMARTRSVRYGEMTVRLIPTESGSASPVRVPIQRESSDETVTGPPRVATPGPPNPGTTGTGTAVPTDPVPAAADPPSDGRRALREARSRRRRTALLCAVVLVVCLALTLLIVGLARDRRGTARRRRLARARSDIRPFDRPRSSPDSIRCRHGVRRRQPLTTVSPAPTVATESPDVSGEWVVAAQAADAKSGEDTVILAMGELLGVTDAFVVTSGRNSRQVRTIVDEVERQVKARSGRSPDRVEGLSDAFWVLMDYGDFLVHVFLDEARAFYDLEHLWSDAPRVRWTATAT